MNKKERDKFLKSKDVRKAFLRAHVTGKPITEEMLIQLKELNKKGSAILKFKN